MENIRIVRFARTDLPFGKMLADRELWGRGLLDWERLLRLEPLGMFKAVLECKDVGIAGVLTYDSIAWIHSVIVLKEFRKHGVGRTLIDACVNLCKDRGISCIKLDSTHGSQGFYERLGFHTEFESLRLVRGGGEFPRVARRVRSCDLREISSFDRIQTGVSRQRILREIYKDNPEWSFLIRELGELRGFVLARREGNCTQIGPCVSDGPKYAVCLLKTILGSAPTGDFRMCVPGKNMQAVRLAMGLGFRKMASSTRMFLGNRFEESEANYAMTSPEKG